MTTNVYLTCYFTVQAREGQPFVVEQQVDDLMLEKAPFTERMIWYQNDVELLKECDYVHPARLRFKLKVDGSPPQHEDSSLPGRTYLLDGPLAGEWIDAPGTVTGELKVINRQNVEVYRQHPAYEVWLATHVETRDPVARYG